MADQNKRIIVDGVDFREILRFPRILKSVLAALQPPRIVIALFMVLLLVSLGRLWDGITGQAAFATASTMAVDSFNSMIQGVLFLNPLLLLGGAGDLFVTLPAHMWANFTTFSIVYGLLFVLIMAVGGGALSRMTAVFAATNQRIAARAAVRYSFMRWLRYFLAPLMPLIAAAVLALIILVLGLLMWVPVLDIIGSIIYVFILLMGLLIAFLLLVYALAFVMVVPALSVEDCDGADAQQRAYGYVLTRPLHLIGYLIIALVGLALGYFVVALFASAVLTLTPNLYATFSGHPALTGIGPYGIFELTRRAEDVELNWHEATSAWFISLWHTLILSLVWAYVVSYFFSASTMIYLLMRRVCDGQDIEEIWQEPEPAEEPA